MPPKFFYHTSSAPSLPYVQIDIYKAKALAQL